MSDLTPEEQKNVRAAMRFLRTRCGDSKQLAKVLRMDPSGIRGVLRGATVSPAMAFRIARLASVGVDDVLTGRFPPAGTCPHCGRCGD